MKGEMELIEILFVEDSPNDQELTMRAFQKVNLTNHVVTVNDGQAALDFLFGEGAYITRNTRDKPKVVFLDLNLPKVHGIEVLRRVRADARTRAIPVVIVTSSGEQKDIVESYNLGVNSYVQKPIDFDGFVKAMADLGFYWAVVNKTPVPSL
jgi:CheY-like chemotaxis protein